VVSVPVRSEKSRRHEALDGLRGIAALFVVIYHIPWTNHISNTNAAGNYFLFVDLFFMLSGFVLAASYLDRIRSAAELSHFIRLRFFRIYPLHFAVLIAFVLLEFVKVIGRQTGVMISERTPFSPPDSFRDILLNVFLVQSLNMTDHMSWNNPSWSISCEAAGYVAFAVATFSGMTRTKTFQIGAIPLAMLGYALVLYLKGTLNATYDLGVVRCLAGLCVGIWAYNLTQSTHLSFVRTEVLSIIALCLVFWVSIALGLAVGATGVVVLPAFALALLYLHQDRGYGAKVLTSQSVRFLGRISYSIYMVHFLVLVLIEIVIKRFVPPSMYFIEAGLQPLKINRWVGDGMALAIVILILLLSSISYKVIEKPWREYGRSRSGQSF
jgi:peptidoglycan/LPS O-acetylase OafA/YrhL